MKDNCFTELLWLLPNINMNQPQVHNNVAAPWEYREEVGRTEMMKTPAEAKPFSGFKTPKKHQCTSPSSGPGAKNGDSFVKIYIYNTIQLTRDITIPGL